MEPVPLGMSPVRSSTKYRYARSIGVDVWTKGDVSPLHRMETRELTDSDAYATGAVVAGQNVMFTVAGGVMRRDNGEDSTLYTGPLLSVRVP